MISDKTLVSDKGNECDGLETALGVIEKTATFCGFDTEGAAKLGRLAEEMISGSAAILDLFSGTLWAETDEKNFMIKLEMEGVFSQDERERLIALTRDNKNTLPKGFFAKLGVLLGDALTGEYVYPFGPGTDVENAELLWSSAQITEMMNKMQNQDPEDKKLEAAAKQVLDSEADDITVSARADSVIITVTMALPQKNN